MLRIKDETNQLMKRYNVLKDAEIKKMFDKPRSYNGPAMEFKDPE